MLETLGDIVPMAWLFDWEDNMTTKWKSLLSLLPTCLVVLGLYVFKNAVLALLLYHVLIVATLGFSLKVSTCRGIWKGWSTPYGLSLIIVASSVGLLLYVLQPVILKDGLDFRQALLGLGLGDHNWLPFALYFSIVHPVLEEMFWRVCLGLEQPVPLADDICFALYHVFVLSFFVRAYWLAIIFCMLVATSYVLKAVYKRCNGLLVPALSHATADVSIAIAASMMRRV